MMDAKTDHILNDLIDAQARLDEARSEVDQLQDARDQLIVRARQTGAGATAIADLIGVKRNSVYKALDRAGMQ